MSKAKGRKAAALDLICDACGAHSPAGSSACKACGKSRFAPEWVRELRRVNRSFAIQVTTPHQLSESDDPKLTLYKWWPGGRAAFNINSAAQWEAVKSIVDDDLAKFLGWATAQKIGRQIKKRKAEAESVVEEFSQAAGQDPRLIVEIVKGLKLDSVSEEDIPKIGESIGRLAEILIGVDESHRAVIERLIKQLPAQGESAIRQLSELMEELTVGQIAAVAGEVKRRVGLLDLFKNRVLDERTYEITGDASIHRLLESAMWIVDERYWLMHSNKQLRTVVAKELAKEDKQYAEKRPDFVCGTVDKKLIVIEIKRPSHTLEVKDLNQLERYVVLCDQYDADHSSFEAILVGNKQSEDLSRTMKVRSSSFKVRTYTQLISDTERRYDAYLKALES